MLLSGNDTTKELLSDCVIGSVHDVFLALLAMEIFPGPPVDQKKGDTEELPLTEITVIVGFSGILSGGLHFSAPLSVAVLLVESILGRMVAVFGADFREALLQLADGIAKNLRVRLSQQAFSGEGLYLTPPVMVYGSVQDLSYGRCALSFRHPFQVDAGAFSVECFYWDNNPL